jgi:hypothetical protein
MILVMLSLWSATSKKHEPLPYSLSEYMSILVHNTVLASSSSTTSSVEYVYDRDEGIIIIK